MITSSWLSAALRCSLPQSVGGSAQRLGIVGAAGSGKTSLLRPLTMQAAGVTRVALYDPFGNIPGVTRTTLRGLISQLRRPRGITRFHDPSLAPALLAVMAELGSCLFVADEAQDIFPRQGCPPESLAALAKGRNTGLGIVWSTQRPTACHTSLLGISQAIIVGRLIGMADRQYSKGWGVEQPQPLFTFTGVFPGMEPFQFQSKKYSP